MDLERNPVVVVGLSLSRSKRLLLKRWLLGSPMGRLLLKELENDPAIEPASPLVVLLFKLPIDNGSTLFASKVLWRPRNEDDRSDCCCCSEF